jgi:hypothetical protein
MDTPEFTCQLILEAVSNGFRSVEEIARGCGGMFPLDLRDVLNGLVASGVLRHIGNGYDLTATPTVNPYTAVPASYVRCIPDLPLPHPLDHDWRFNPPTIAHLVEMVCRLATPNGRALLLGAPTVFAALVSHPEAPPTTLVDRNWQLLRSLDQGTNSQFRVHQQDLLSGPDTSVPPGVDVTLCDPPWYPEHYRAYLAQASLVTRIGGRVLISLLPVLTRPSAIDDRTQLLGEAHDFGLHLRSLTPDCLGYESPPFELVSLAVGGIHPTGSWRRGDLIEFWKAREPDPTATAGVWPDKSGKVEDWFKVHVDKRPIWLRGPFLDENEPPNLVHIEDGDVLPTVSRRYTGRTAVDLWLWDNRVFGVEGRAAFRDALRSLSSLAKPAGERIVPAEYMARALDLLHTIPGLTDVIDERVGGSVAASDARDGGGSSR